MLGTCRRRAHARSPFSSSSSQAVFNCRRRSTQGWSILNILLDFTGGALSLGQQLLSCWWAGNWAPVTANPVKMGLALTSMGMDLVFMVQHYVLYAEPPGSLLPETAPGAGGGAAAARGAAKLPGASAAAAADVRADGGALAAPLLGPRGVVVAVESEEEAL
jgi:hypothetical protein